MSAAAKTKPPGGPAPRADRQGLASQADSLLDGVHEDWMPFISRPLLAKALADIDALGDADCTSPPARDIFNFLRDCAPSDIIGTVMGQDPYPTKGDAMGYCFSARRSAGSPNRSSPSSTAS